MILDGIFSLESLGVPWEIEEEAEARPSMDEVAFHRFYGRTSRPLWSYILRLCGDAAMADDILQDAYCRFLRAKLRETEHKKLKSYLYRIATNLVTDQWRKGQREQRLAKDDRLVPDPPKDASIALNQKADFSRSFALLKPKKRALLWLAYVEGQDHRQIAASPRLFRMRAIFFRARNKRTLTLFSLTPRLAAICR